MKIICVNMFYVLKGGIYDKSKKERDKFDL